MSRATVFIGEPVSKSNAESGLPDAPRVDGSAPSSSYNVLLTARWMMVVPRTAEQHGGVFVNSVGFAGYLLLKDAGAYATYAF